MAYLSYTVSTLPRSARFDSRQWAKRRTYHVPITPGHSPPGRPHWRRATGRLALTGERFDAALAREVGLVHEICPAAELEAAGARFVDHLLLAGPEAVAITKKLIAEAVETPFAGAFHDRIVAAAATRPRTPEAAKGLASFREKRKPAWYPGT